MCEVEASLAPRYADLRKKLADQEALLAAADRRAAALAERVNIAWQEVLEVRRAMAFAKRAIQTEKCRLKAARKDLETVRLRKRQAHKKHTDASTRSRRVHRIHDSLFVPLRDGSCLSVKPAIRQLHDFAVDVRLDPLLLDVYPPSLTKAPVERGAFDMVLVSHMEEEFERIVVEVRATADAISRDMAELAEAVTVAKGTIDVGRTKLRGSRAALIEARKKVRETRSAHQAAKNDCATAKLGREEIVAAIQEAQSQLAEFEGGPVLQWLERIERTPPKAARARRR